MDRYTKPRLEHVKADTWCIVTGSSRIPLYMPDRGNAVMIDSGLKNPDRYGILAVLEQENIHVSALLTSHFHRDHIGNHQIIKSRYDCRVYMSPVTASYCSDPLKFGAYESNLLSKLRGRTSTFTPDVIYDPNADTLEAAGYNFQLIPLPGHAPEHTGFVTPDGVAYLGDTILSRDILYAVRIPYCTNCKEDLEAKEKAGTLNHDLYILAHNAICTDIRELARENIDNMHEKINMVQQFASSYITLEALTAKVIAHTGGDPNSLVKVVGSKRNVQVLVDYLLETERLDVRARDGYIEYIKNT